MHIVVTGAGGRLGAAMAAGLGRAGHRITALSRSQLNVADRAFVRAILPKLRPEAIVNCSAYNAVDAAETEYEAAFAVNADGPAALADAARDCGALLVHYSTDFVFDGEASVPYEEDAPARPVNVYGASKLAGEREAGRVPQHYILRVESLFGGTTANAQKATVDYLAEGLLAGAPVRAVADRTVSPSYVDDVVRATRSLLALHAPFGTYHCVSSGSANWFEVATEIASRLNVTAATIGAVKASELPSIAARPRFCALSNRKLKALGVDLPAWNETVAQHLALRYHGRHREARLRSA